VAEDEMWRTFNMGVGMLAIVPDAQRSTEVLRGLGVDAWICGRVTDQPGVRMLGVR
jgi:phosphoribosylformylglycinamidine cyclo-ligase